MTEETTVVTQPVTAPALTEPVESFDPFGIDVALAEIQNATPADTVPPADDEPSEEDDDAPEVETEQQAKPKTAKGRISELSKASKEKDAKIAALEQQMAAMAAKMQPLENLANGLDALGITKQEAQKLSLDEQLQTFNINPDDYDSDGEKRLALQGAKHEQRIQQQNTEAAFNHIEMHVYDTIMARGDEQRSNGELGAVNYLIQDKAADLVEELGISQQDALLQAKREVLYQAGLKAKKTGRDITDVLIEKGVSVFSRRNVGVNKDLQNSNKEATIDHKAREQVARRAGKPVVDTVFNPNAIQVSDSFMKEIGMAGW
jgi:hypothetical protein